jgi:Tfp pilus assembly protein PilE
MRAAGVTLVEALTAIVVLVVIAAVAIPLWRTRELRAHRQVAMDALLAIQTAQDRHFGQHARYAGLDQLGARPDTADYSLEIKLGDDELAYVATARIVPSAAVASDSRCTELSVDQHGRRFARDESGGDSTADCWDRK